MSEKTDNQQVLCNIEFKESERSVTCESCTIDAHGDFIKGGVALTGFFDVEKRININRLLSSNRAILLEKKLPFQILLAEFECPGIPTTVKKH